MSPGWNGHITDAEWREMFEKVLRCRLGLHRPHKWDVQPPSYVAMHATYCERCGCSLSTGGVRHKASM